MDKITIEDLDNFESYSIRKRFWLYAQLITGNSYTVDFENKEPLAKIIQTIERGEKGILLCGKTGSGKTFIFEILNKILYAPFDKRRIVVKHVSNIVSKYEAQGDDALYQENNINICFDELGREKNPAKHYGSDCDVMQSVIAHRYNLFKKENKLTFFTSNYSKNDLRERYGDHSYSRLIEMTEIINLGISTDHSDRRINAKKLIYNFPEVIPYKKQNETNQPVFKKRTHEKYVQPERKKISEILKNNLNLD